MAKLPDPPADLASRTPDIHTLPAGASLARLYYASGAHPVAWDQFRHWGPGSGARFDHHLPDAAGRAHVQERGILYCAEQGITCLAEVFQASRAIDRTRGDPHLVAFSTQQPLRLIDLTGEFATRMGASLAIHSGPRSRTRMWARALYDAFGNAHGLLYLSSMHPSGRAIALNERAHPAIPPSPDFNRALADPVLTDIVDECIDRLGYRKV